MSTVAHRIQIVLARCAIYEIRSEIVIPAAVQVPDILTRRSRAYEDFGNKDMYVASLSLPVGIEHDNGIANRPRRLKDSLGAETPHTTVI